MRNQISFLLFLLIISNDIVHGKLRNRTTYRSELKKPADNEINIRSKRATSESLSLNNERNNIESAEKRKYYSDPKVVKEPPFWGNRGRRNSEEDYENRFLGYKYINSNNDNNYLKTYLSYKRDDEEKSPFWGNRGRRDSMESEEILSRSSPLCSKDKKQDDEPFWGTRGRREEYPFWGNRGRRENYVSSKDDNSPFWGNRGRREESEPFWGNRGRRENLDTFRGMGREEMRDGDTDLIEDKQRFWVNIGQRKSQLEVAIIKAINDVTNKMAGEVAGERRYDDLIRNHDMSRRIRYLFGMPRDNKMSVSALSSKTMGNELAAKKSEHHTVHDDRIYAEQPHYIIVERSSRSSAELDPFYISRGKKFSDSDTIKAKPVIRSAIEDLVKSVRNDPYYIARGKKYTDEKLNITSLNDEGGKFKEFVCSILNRSFGRNIVKRDISKSNERDRRTILKNLALKLQMDPYFVSRGKKSSNEDEINFDKQSFIKHMIATCI